MPETSNIPARNGKRLLERSDQLNTLEQGLTATKDGSGGRVMLVSGEAGVGKTALLREFCRRASGSARILWAGCDPLFTPRPLGPLRDLAEATSGPLAASVTGG